MRFLLDTHVWIWSQEDPERIGPQTRRLLVSPQHENHICTISTLELARLAASGDITMSMAVQEWVERAVSALQAKTLGVSHQVAVDAYALPGSFHKDPADRVLVAAARCHDLTVLTADGRMRAYNGVRSRAPRN